MLKKVINRIIPNEVIYARLKMEIKNVKYLPNNSYLMSNNKYYFCNRQKNNGIKIDNNFKQQSKQFFNQHVQKIVQLKKSTELNLILASSNQFVVLDLYADWCGPCKQLTPRLQKKVNQMQNVKLVKVNIDKCPEIAQALSITSVPTVYLVYMNQPLQKFQGNPSQNEFNHFFQMINKIKETSPDISKILTKIETARQLLINKKKPQQAAKLLEQITDVNVSLSVEMNCLKFLLLSRCYFLLNKKSKFRSELKNVESYKKVIQQNKQFLELYNNLQLDLKSLDKELDADPIIKQMEQKLNNAQNIQQSLSAKFQLVNYYKDKQNYEKAFEIAMEIVKEEKHWEDKKTNKLILTMFKELGENSPLVHKYRKIFQRILY